MRILITAVLAITWYGLGTQPAQPIATSLVQFLLLGGIVVVWLDEHWLDVDIKLVIPALLLLMLNQAVHSELSTRYEGYPTPALLTLGLAWLLATLVVGLVLDALFRRKADREAEAAD